MRRVDTGLRAKKGGWDGQGDEDEHSYTTTLMVFFASLITHLHGGFCLNSASKPGNQ